MDREAHSQNKLHDVNVIEKMLFLHINVHGENAISKAIVLELPAWRQYMFGALLFCQQINVVLHLVFRVYGL